MLDEMTHRLIQFLRVHDESRTTENYKIMITHKM